MWWWWWQWCCGCSRYSSRDSSTFVCRPGRRGPHDPTGGRGAWSGGASGGVALRPIGRLAMRHLLAFSGGKDSTAAALVSQERGITYTAVFADTGWEHPLTYGYVWGAAETFLAAHDLQVLRSSKYEGFMDLVVRRKMIPGKVTRFCTQELKIFPLWDYIATIDDDVTLYQGIRAEESLPRTRAGPRD